MPDGELAAPGARRLSARPPFGPFSSLSAAITLLVEEMTADSVTTNGDTAVQVGRFRQRVQVPAGDTVEVRRGFRAAWLRDRLGIWHLRRLGTAPRSGDPPRAN